MGNGKTRRRVVLRSPARMRLKKQVAGGGGGAAARDGGGRRTHEEETGGTGSKAVAGYAGLVVTWAFL